MPESVLLGQNVKSDTAHFENYYLVISIDESDEYKDGDFWIILDHDQAAIEALEGEQFTIVTPGGKLFSAELTGSHPTDLVSNLAQYPVGKLKLKGKVNSYPPRTHMLAIRNEKPEAKLVGRVADVEKSESLYKMKRAKIKDELPEEMQVSLPILQRIYAPGPEVNFLFTGVEYFDPEEYRKAGDHALQRTDYLFKLVSGKPTARIKMSDNLVSKVYSVTDLNKDGIWELLVGTNTGFGGTYEIRLLNDEQLSVSRSKLYEWGH